MNASGPVSSLLLCLLVLVGSGACAAQDEPPRSNTSTPVSCSARILVGFARETRIPPDEGLVRQVGDAAQVRLTYVRSISASVHLFVVSSASDCDEVLQRLRSDSRIASADLDTRRKVQ